MFVNGGRTALIVRKKQVLDIVLFDFYKIGSGIDAFCGNRIIVICYFRTTMNIPSYEFSSSNDQLLFYFESVSGQKIVKKVVRFEEIGNGIYNLSLGDIDIAGNVSDMSVSNNQDMEMILATVVQAILFFFAHYPDQKVYFESSTYSRTRLYRIAISNYLYEFEDLFNIYGEKDGQFERFEPNKNYESFVITLK